jgi:hypothetical protein
MADLFEELTTLLIWRKAITVLGLDPVEWRQDEFGNLIRFSEYGDRTSPHGWEKDPIKAVALGGTDDLDNVRPLHFRTNASLGGLLGLGLGGATSHSSSGPRSRCI